MVIVWGERFTGNVDAVPGLFHVSTKFGHIYYLPILPEQSFLVLEKTGNGIRGVPLPFSWKSLGVAWARVAIGGLALGAVISLFVMLDQRHSVLDIVIPSLTLAGAIALLIWSYFMPRVGRASYERAMELAVIAQLNEEGMLRIGEAFGKVSPEDAKAMRQKIAAARIRGAVVGLARQ